jgi:hypothetical protein
MLTTLTTDDELTKLAKQAGFNLEFDDYVYEHWNSVQAFAKLVDAKATAREREACAQILANTDLSGLQDHPLQDWVAGMLFEFIKAIRARGTNE